MADVRNILVGAANIFVSRGTGASRPVTKPGSASTAIAGSQGDVNWSATQSARQYLSSTPTNWREIGYTNNGLEVSYEPGYNDVMVDQLLDAARLFKSTIRVMLRTELTESTLENMQLVFGQNENNVTYSSTGQANTNPVLDFQSGTSLDASKVTVASSGTANTALTGQTVSPVTAASVSSAVTFTNYPTFNVVRDSSGAVVGTPTLVYAGTGITAGNSSGSLKLLGTAQTYAGGTGASGQDIVLAIGASAAAAAAATLALQGGALGDAPVERTIVAVGNAPYQIGATGEPVPDTYDETKTGTTSTSAKKERVYVARRVVQVETSSHGLKRDAATVFPVQFRCLPDDNDLYDGAEYGVIIDRVFG